MAMASSRQMALGNEGSESSFHGIWDPRIGREAADILAKQRYVTLLAIPAAVALGLLTVSVRGPLLWAAYSLVLIVDVTPIWILSHRTNRRLARAMSAHLGFEVTPGSLPSMKMQYIDQFDKWVTDTRSGTPRREWKIFGGFIRFSLPPK